MKSTALSTLVSVFVSAMLLPPAGAFHGPGRARLSDFDKRSERARPVSVLSDAQRSAVSALRKRVPSVRVEFDESVRSPRFIGSTEGFLSGPGGEGRAISQAVAGGIRADDPYRATKAFLAEHRALFGHGPEALAAARIAREFVSPHHGLRTVVWEQQADGIPLFGARLISHTTAAGELVNLSSQFLPDPVRAVESGARLSRLRQKASSLTARAAVVRAAQNLGEKLTAEEVTSVDLPPAGVTKQQRFKAASLKGDTHASLVWLPMDSESLVLCWDILLTSRTRGEMFRVLIDAETGEALVRRCLTEYLSEASYRVFTSDSPTPLSPGHPTPQPGQPPLAPRALVTLGALNTNASPAGWIADGDNETRGNNVDAHLDLDANDVPDLPRPQGSPSRVFDFPINLSQEPDAYGDASVVQLFYWNNWIHDQFYELGFTEAAGNFQTDNFGRGGFTNDAMQADAQDGMDTDNANISIPPDGFAPRMQMFLWTSPTPHRDSSLDAEIVIHEYTHGLSHRRVGGGDGLSASQSRGMGEGWSDFYGLSLLSEPGDDVDGVYAAGAYSSYLLGGLQENYYFGIRRYPYCIDLLKNPLTFKDIDPDQAGEHPGVPLSPLFNYSVDPGEVHAQGEVWCVTLWEARANLIRQHGFATGNRLMLQLVTDGMNLTPPNPTFLEARDAILQADRVLTGGANQNGLWAAFARRGMGLYAMAPPSFTTRGVEESFDLPGGMAVFPRRGFTANGPVGGPFAQGSLSFGLTNLATNSITWSATANVGWLALSQSGGTLGPDGATTQVTVSLDASAYALPAGIHGGSVLFSNVTLASGQVRDFTLRVGQPDYFTEFFNNDFDLKNTALTFIPDGSANFYFACREPATNFLTDPAGGTPVDLSGLWNQTVEVNLEGGARVPLYGAFYNTLYLDYGLINFAAGEPELPWNSHFNRPRISALIFAYQPPYSLPALVDSWKQLPDRVAVTFRTGAQVEMFFDGRIRMTFLDIGVVDSGIVGLSRGQGSPADFVESDLSSYGPCLRVVVPTTAREGDGTLTGAGRVILPGPISTNVVVRLSSSDVSEVRVPTRVTVPAGEREAVFDVTILDDAVVDGTQYPIITASTPRFGSAQAVLAVDDTETATLVVNLPATAMEGDGTLQGSILVSEAPASDVTVLLSSSDANELQVPPFVRLRAGETSVDFTATVVDDVLIDGPRPATITAHVAYWTDAAATVTVADNEPLDLALSLPSGACEGDVTLAGAGLVTLTGFTTTNVVVALQSTDPNRLRVPATTTVVAGQSFARFDLTLVNNALVDGEQAIAITATRPGWNGATNTFIVRDDDLPPVPDLPSPPDRFTDVPATVRLSWWPSGWVGGDVLQNGGFETGDFTGWGIWVVDDEAPGFVINDGTFNPEGPDRPTAPFAGTFSAVSAPYAFPTTALYQNIVVPDCEGAVTLRWVDRIRNYATRFDDHQFYQVGLEGPFDPPPRPVPTHFLAPPTSPNGGLPFLAYSTQPGDPLLNDWTERSVDISIFRGRGARVVFHVVSELGSLNVHLDNVRVVVAPNPTPIRYDVYFGTNAVPGPGEFLGTTTNAFWDLPLLAPATTYFWQVVARRIGQTSGPVWQFTTRGVDHFEWSPLAPTQFIGQPFAVTVTAKDAFGTTVTSFNSPVTLEAGGIAIHPTATESFVHGAWSGSITALHAGGPVVLTARDGVGHAGTSSPITISAPDNVAVTASVAPNPVAVGEELNFDIAVENYGPSIATGVALTNFLPASVTFLSAVASQGGCFNAGNVVICDLGTLPGGGLAHVSIVARADAAGTFTNRAVASRTESEFFTGDNAASTVTTVLVPTLSIDNASVTEGDTGTRSASFAASLFPITSHPVTVRFATSNDTAEAANDFIGTNGVLVFNSGESNQTITVLVHGDLLYEPDESFRVVLFDPTNGVLAAGSDTAGTGTIINDDAVPELILPPASAPEGTPLLLTLQLTRPAGIPIVVEYRTQDYQARAGSDYLAATGSVTFAPGLTNATFSITTLSDAVCEGPEYFFLNLYPSPFVTSIRSTAPVILNDDTAAPAVAASHARLVSEGHVPANGFIDAGETVALDVTLEHICGTNTTNLVATLLPTGGVTVPSASQNYGALTPAQPRATRRFSFTAEGTNGGPLTVTFQMHDGTMALGTHRFQFHLGSTPDFVVSALSTGNCQIAEASEITGFNSYYWSGLAASASNLFFTGSERTGRFPLDDLGHGSRTDGLYFGLVSNLRTETAYVVATSDAFSQWTGTITALRELDPDTGAFTGHRVTLTPPLPVEGLLGSLGLFSGYDRVVIHAQDGRVFSIALPGGEWTELGRVSQGTHAATWTGNYWGVAEHFGGADYLVYVKDAQNIVRKRISDGGTVRLAGFDNLGDMSGFTVSIPRNRWYFAHAGASQFNGGGLTVGACDARFSFDELLRIASVSLNGSAVQVRVGTIAGKFYRLERADDVAGATWSAVLDNVVGTGGVMELTDPAGAGQPSRFYRVRSGP